MTDPKNNTRGASKHMKEAIADVDRAATELAVEAEHALADAVHDVEVFAAGASADFERVGYTVLEGVKEATRDVGDTVEAAGQKIGDVGRGANRKLRRARRAAPEVRHS